jgi:hypothetical protein
MTYSSWGNVGIPCSRQFCRCLQYRFGPSSEGLRERASSYQSDNDPDFLRSANPAGKRSRICGATCAWRPSYGGRTHIPRRKTGAPCGRHRFPALRPYRREVQWRNGDAGNRRDQSRGAGWRDRVAAAGLLIRAPLRRNLDQFLKAVQRHTGLQASGSGNIRSGGFPGVRHSLSSSPHDNRY